MMKRLRISHVVVQPVLVWDDGIELEAGPQLNALQLPASGLVQFAAQLPSQVADLAEQLAADSVAGDPAQPGDPAGLLNHTPPQ
jgi:hypothetical protein